MALIFETEKYRHKKNKSVIISLLKIDAEDEDYREPVFIYKYVGLNENWQVSLNRKFLDDWEEIQDE